MSKIFYVSYDLKDADSGDYSDIENVLVNDFNGIRVQKSLWCLKLNDDYECSDVRDELRNLFDKEDKIIVILTEGYSCRGYIDEPHSFDEL